MSDELKDFRTDIKTLQQQMRELYGEIQTLSFVLKGSNEMKGIFQRLQDSEQKSLEYNEKTNQKIDLLDRDIDQRFEAMDNKFELLLVRIEANNTNITTQLVQLHTLRTNVLSVINIFKSKYFWRAFIAIMGLIAWGKSYNSIIDMIKTILKDI